MHNSPGRQDGAVLRRSSLFCSAVAFLRDARVGVFTAGALVFFAALIVALTASNFFDSYIPLYIFVAADMSGQIAHILACKRESAYGDLVEFCVRYAVLGLCLWLAVSYLAFSLILGVLVIFIGPFVGDKAAALLRKKLRL